MSTDDRRELVEALLGTTEPAPELIQRVEAASARVVKPFEPEMLVATARKPMVGATPGVLATSP